MTTTIIKAISLHQPWATFIPMGLKKYETRSWHTSYRGQLLICAAKKVSTSQKLTHNYLINKYQQLLTQTDNYLEWQDLPFGCAVTLVDLTACIKMTPQFINQQPETEIDTGDWKPGRFAWQLDNIRPIVPPISVIGKQGLFNVEVDLSEYGLEAVA
ncbi:ASCH domain-containing protein [Nostoc sp. UHCC 0870]|uniref:ASCH domain-containing protein n=1 Tax=Nostoc sp. UHCC 0870 TaxID=2914041 RepID=UPI001EE13A63|nr:ASCH domain-containing protein [Nostoc sp. UHCC 0870]UKP01110.1 ASCH domain-containing protein [Nostoc sp. UHCC 0870]